MELNRVELRHVQNRSKGSQVGPPPAALKKSEIFRTFDRGEGILLYLDLIVVSHKKAGIKKYMTT